MDITDTIIGDDRNIELFKLADTLFEDMCKEDGAGDNLFTKRIILIIDIVHKFLLLLYIHQTVKIPKNYKNIFEKILRFFLN